MFKKLLVTVCCVLSVMAVEAKTLIPKPPELAAKGWLLIDADTGRILVEHNAREPLPPASLTKMMTSYIVSNDIHNGKISEDDMVPISVEAWRMGGSRMFVKEGTSVRLIDLMRGMIIQSGNDATVALAEYVAGSESAFADVMNQQAQLLGMKDTNFENATGWPEEGHVTTAFDLSLLARRLINDHPEHYKIYAEKYFKYNIAKPQPNRNRLLWRDKSVDGIKTGHTNEAGYCLVASAVRDDMRLISVVMGTNSEESRARESQKLLAYGFRYYETLNVYKKNHVLKEGVRVWYGKDSKINLVVPEDVYLTIPRGSSKDLDAVTRIDEKINAPITQGQELGRFTVTLRGETVTDLPLVSDRDVAEAGMFSRLWDAIKLFFMGLFS